MSERPRVAFFLPSFAGGGAERALLQVANAFVTRGLAVDLMVGDANGPYADEVSGGINVVVLGKKRVAACLPGLIRYLKASGPKAIVSTMMHANIVVIVARLISRQAVRVVVRESNVAEVWNGKPLAEGKSLLLRLAGLLYPRADAVVCVSQGVKNSLVEAVNLDRSKMSVIMNPVVSEQFFQLASQTPESSDLFAGPYIIAVGRLAKVKGFDILIRAFAEYRKVHEVNLLILGEGPQRSELEALAEALGLSSEVHMPGFVKNPFPLLKNASLFVMSSRREGLPNALIQAIALGLPAVVTNMPDGPTEIMDGERYGITVPIDDIEALSVAMLTATAKDDWPAPDQTWYSRFSEEQVVDQYLHSCGLDAKKISCVASS